MVKLASEDIIEIRKRVYDASKLPFVTWGCSKLIEGDVPALLEEVKHLREGMEEISIIVSSFYSEQDGIRLPLNLSHIAGELQVIHKIAGENRP